MILKNIYLDKSFIFFLIIIILTGNFNYFIPYFLLLFIHEMGHAIAGVLLGYKLKRIMFYSLGGITIFDFPLNIPLRRELFILLMGPLLQICGYFFLKLYFPFITSYHYTLLIFNLLPIYPLDGGKILNILCSYCYNYLMSFKITFVISVSVNFCLFIYNFYFFNLNFLIMIVFILFKLISIYKKRYIYYNKFLLERYLYNYNFNKIKNVSNIKRFYRDRRHYINFLDEKLVLKKYFKSR